MSNDLIQRQYVLSMILGIAPIGKWHPWVRNGRDAGYTERRKTDPDECGGNQYHQRYASTLNVP